jgi:hypothetical protein
MGLRCLGQFVTRSHFDMREPSEVAGQVYVAEFAQRDASTT